MPTVSPDYMQRGISNPFYTVNTNTERIVKNKLKSKKVTYKKLIFKCVYKVSGETILDSRGKFLFQLTDNKTKILPYNVKLIKKEVLTHYGMPTRKDSTASSNVNEFLTVYFLKQKYEGTRELENRACKEKVGKTGVLDGDEKPITYERLCELIDKDATAERDIKVGYQNSLAVKKDIKPNKIKNVYWTPKSKPKDINPKTPSDVIIEFIDHSFQGYSNKLADKGKDVTPKFNTNVYAYYGKLGDTNQQKIIGKLINKAWNDATKKVPRNKKFAKGAIESFDITKEAFSESISKQVFADLAKSFKKDGLDFYEDGFYYLFRNNFIRLLGKHITNPDNLVYFLNTINFYTYGDSKIKYSPCPYKLLIGRTGQSSKILNVSEDTDLKNLLINKKSKKLKKIRFNYDNKSQSFKMTFIWRKKDIEIPITTRTRAAGGWAGKSLFITTPGLEIN